MATAAMNAANRLGGLSNQAAQTERQAGTASTQRTQQQQYAMPTQVTDPDVARRGTIDAIAQFAQQAGNVSFERAAAESYARAYAEEAVAAASDEVTREQPWHEKLFPGGASAQGAASYRMQSLQSKALADGYAKIKSDYYGTDPTQYRENMIGDFGAQYEALLKDDPALAKQFASAMPDMISNLSSAQYKANASFVQREEQAEISNGIAALTHEFKTAEPGTRQQDEAMGKLVGMISKQPQNMDKHAWNTTLQQSALTALLSGDSTLHTAMRYVKPDGTLSSTELPDHESIIGQLTQDEQRQLSNARSVVDTNVTKKFNRERANTQAEFELAADAGQANLTEAASFYRQIGDEDGYRRLVVKQREGEIKAQRTAAVRNSIYDGDLHRGGYTDTEIQNAVDAEFDEIASGDYSRPEEKDLAIATTLAYMASDKVGILPSQLVDHARRVLNAPIGEDGKLNPEVMAIGAQYDAIHGVSRALAAEFIGDNHSKYLKLRDHIQSGSLSSDRQMTDLLMGDTERRVLSKKETQELSKGVDKIYDKMRDRGWFRKGARGADQLYNHVQQSAQYLLENDPHVHTVDQALEIADARAHERFESLDGGYTLLDNGGTPFHKHLGMPKGTKVQRVLNAYVAMRNDTQFAPDAEGALPTDSVTFDPNTAEFLFADIDANGYPVNAVPVLAEDIGRHKMFAPKVISNDRPKRNIAGYTIY
jgi:hypothetical protein